MLHMTNQKRYNIHSPIKLALYTPFFGLHRACFILDTSTCIKIQVIWYKYKYHLILDVALVYTQGI
jgi:hypothetical protein